MLKLAYIVALIFAVTFSSCTGNSGRKSGSVETTEKQAATFTNPLLPQGADPWSVFHNGFYYYMQTSPDSLVLWKTADLTDLKNAPKKTIWIPTEPSRARDLWAPEIHYIDKKWYVYYAADDGDTDNHQLYVLENENADPFEEEFSFKERISTDKDNNWAIDASLFEYNEELYMVWSGWQTRRIDTETQCIYIAKMQNPWTLASERVLISKPELEWERHYINESGWTPDYKIFVNEGPQPLKSPNGKYIHIAYSASGVWTPYYALGMLTATVGSDLLDPESWVKSQEPVFSQSPENGVYGSGHNSFFKSPDGKEIISCTMPVIQKQILWGWAIHVRHAPRSLNGMKMIIRFLACLLPHQKN